MDCVEESDIEALRFFLFQVSSFKFQVVLVLVLEKFFTSSVRFRLGHSATQSSSSLRLSAFASKKLL